MLATKELGESTEIKRRDNLLCNKGAGLGQQGERYVAFAGAEDKLVGVVKSKAWKEKLRTEWERPLYQGPVRPGIKAWGLLPQPGDETSRGVSAGSPRIRM